MSNKFPHRDRQAKEFAGSAHIPVMRRPRANSASRFIAIPAVAMAALLLAGCAGTSDGSANNVESSVAVGAPSVMDDSAIAKGAVVAGDRSITRTGSMTIRVASLDEAGSDYRDLAIQFGGEITDEYSGSDGTSPYATLTAKIPAENMDAFMLEARKFGEVLSTSSSANDVTLAVNDLNARITALEAATARLRDLLKEATDIADVVAIESELTTRQVELDGLKAQQRSLNDQVVLATVSVNFTPNVSDVSVPAPGFVAGLQSGWNALVSLASSATTAAGIAIPFLALGLLLALVAITAVKVTRRRRGPTHAVQHEDANVGNDRASE